MIWIISSAIYSNNNKKKTSAKAEVFILFQTTTRSACGIKEARAMIWK